MQKQILISIAVAFLMVIVAPQIGVPIFTGAIFYAVGASHFRDHARRRLEAYRTGLWMRHKHLGGEVVVERLTAVDMVERELNLIM